MRYSIVLTVALLCVALVGCSDNSEGKENLNMQGGMRDNVEETGDFSLAVTASKTTVNVGETIEITATFKNLSGKDVVIELTTEATVCNYELEDILYIKVHPEDLEVSWGISDIGILYPKTKKTIEKDAVITRTIKHTFVDPGNYKSDSMVAFHFDGENERFWLESKPIIIKVR